MDEVTLEFAKETMKFSAGHFTIFSATKRERLHGHNFQVQVSVSMKRDPLGLKVDYRFFKEVILELCQRWDEYLLIAAHSPHLVIENKSSSPLIEITFHEERMSFLKKDVILLPITNTTVEELSYHFLNSLKSHHLLREMEDLTQMVVKISSGSGQWGVSSWQKENISSVSQGPAKA